LAYEQLATVALWLHRQPPPHADDVTTGSESDDVRSETRPDSDPAASTGNDVSIAKTTSDDVPTAKKLDVKNMTPRLLTYLIIDADRTLFQLASPQSFRCNETCTSKEQY